MGQEADDVNLCCVPLVRTPLSTELAEHLARQLKVVADPTRLRLISMITAHDGGEACVCDLTAPLGLTQPTVSHHLKVLLDAGLVTRTKRGVWSYYRVVSEALAGLASLFSDDQIPSGATASAATASSVPSTSTSAT
ncbi:MAG: ArsR/SmtB family transcription factor [Streptosporangiaceae bacterium]